MAATSDSTVTGGRGRASTSNIVFAIDRTVSRRVAHNHTKRVRRLKVILPLIAVGTVAVFLLTVMNNAGIGPAMPDLEIPQIVAENLKMKNPHYEGFQSDGGRYWVKAETAQQDLKSLSVVHLDGITGDLLDVKKQKTHLVATRGLFDNKANTLELFDSIRVTGDGGLNATLTQAKVKTKEGIITSDQPSTIVMGAGQITSNQLTIRQKTKEYTFLDNVRTHIKPKEPPPGEQQTEPSLPFGKSGEPIDVTASRLDVDDNKKVALFTGQVTATQAGATLVAPEMTVTYEGAVAPQSGTSQSTANAPAESGTRVKQVIAKDSVTLTQASGETATSRTATFDTAAQLAVLEGDVVLTQGADKKAVGDRAEYDEADQKLTLTGPVVVTQGQSVLRGRRLVFHRATNKMQLMAETETSSGRITAHFVKPAAKTSTKNSDSDQSDSSEGIPFGLAFKTDPNAPYDVTSNRLDVDDSAKTALFTGDVVTVQGNFTIQSGEMTAYYTGRTALAPSGDNARSGASLTHIRAKKSVTVVSKDGQKASGDWAEVDVKTNLATLGGNVVLTQGKNVVRGTKLLIDMTTGQATIKTEPTASSERSMVSAGGISNNGQTIKADRPSAVFYPGEFGKKAKSASEAIDGWQARSSR
jgi:LPS export ABC transporter protein LptC/lipopolysaccharide transport protein LptA